MSPDHVSILMSLLGTIKLLSTWPFAVFFFILIVGPWMLSLMLFYSQRKQYESHMRKVKQMYENNVRLVESYISLGGRYEALAKDLKDVIMMNTQTMTTLNDAVKGNQFCPVVRREGGTA